MNKATRLIVLIGLKLIPILAICQKNAGIVTEDPTPLHFFLQKNFDTTFIYNSYSSWFPFANYKIIARKKEQIFFFTYRQPYGKYAGGYSFPGGLEQRFMEEVRIFKSSNVDTNRFFLPIDTRNDIKQNAWQSINKIIWNLRQDPGKSSCSIDDAEQSDFFSITPDKICYYSYYYIEDINGCKNRDSLNLKNAQRTKDIFDRSF